MLLQSMMDSVVKSHHGHAALLCTKDVGVKRSIAAGEGYFCRNQDSRHAFRSNTVYEGWKHVLS